ncbi:sialate O-acetylesterase [Chitinophagaceae bacterium LWZ2-11]
MKMKNTGKKIFTFVVCIVFIHLQDATAQIKLPKLVSSGMVLQREQPIKIWGWAAPGEKVNIRFNNKEYNTITDATGKWLVKLSSMKAGGPYNMQLTASNKIELTNILIGDVWVCSGQSNMELPMERVKDKYRDIIANANNTNIRQFNVATNYTFKSTVQDFPNGNWEGTTLQSVLHFTAVGYFFAKALYEKYGVPIGLIKSSVGGSPAEAWLSEDALKAFPDYYATAQQLKNDNYIDSIKRSDNATANNWYSRLYSQDKGLHESLKWFDAAYNDADWNTMPVPGYWNDYGLKNTNGVVWFRKEITVPASMIGKPARLILGTIVDRDSVFVNGVFAGTTGYQYPPRKYDLPAGLLKEGKNVITVRVINSAGKGGFTFDKAYELVANEQKVDLKGDWKFKLGTSMQPLPNNTFFQYKPEGLYNAMIAPLVSYGIKGVIWYQGEANTGKPNEYTSLLSALINSWRSDWKQGAFPFLFVQLANFMQTKDQPSESNWAALREAQRKTLAVPNTGMAVITDIGEWNDIHPLNKEDVGKRLAFAAQKVAYGDKKVVYSGPLYKSMRVEGNKIIISFTNVGGGLIAKGSDTLKYFAIAGTDRKFVWAKAEIKGDKVIVWNESITNPVVVRYAWADNPEGANLYNKEGLPASAFSSE